MSENRRGIFLTHTIDSLNGCTDLFSF